MTILKITVSKEVDISDPLVYTPDALRNFKSQILWNNTFPDPTVYDEIRREIIETAYISELRVENVEVIEEVIPKTKEEKIAFSKEWDRRYEEGKRNGNSSRATVGFDFSDAGEPG